MSAFLSAIYTGRVTHRRMRPKRHFLRYRMFYMLLDIDEIKGIALTNRWFSHNRFNLFSFFDRDHGSKFDAAAGCSDLRAYVENHLREARMVPDGGPIKLMTMPRILGYVFNPLSVYFCHDVNGTLKALIYEVNNTFGQRHSYVFQLDDTDDGKPLHQECRKEFYVSPFMDMALDYDFTITRPSSSASVVINASDQDGLIIATAFAGQRREFSDWNLLKLFFGYPLLTLKVIAGIHWEALWIRVKGVRIKPRPQTPIQTRTIIPQRTKSDIQFSK
ncbi:DUF1365 domain-containing protein [Phyllobacterium myrsinacearum]|uniref:DUF1365 domain-containing protein n=1 Tax=Phyllobacterium myrsinacearum TaxID=28101 RepID=A0A839EP59_9HYPH|nr:DUF1365 domain-containing protein [Phyllobacterium myrsinacearum]MBA8879955.1 hypothetical protein [Phyllobacterium myrsinacearum]